MAVEEVSGQLSLLRVHRKGGKYGPPSDQIDVEVVVQFVDRPGEAFGLQLRDDSQLPAREGMLALLRDGFNHGWIVTIDCERSAGKRNGVAFRVWLTKPPRVRPPIVGGLSINAGTAPLRRAKAKRGRKRQ